MNMHAVPNLVTAAVSPSGLSDGDVIQRVLAGETALFEVLMRRHNQRLYRAARSILRDDAEAEDVMQETYVRAFAHLAQFDGRAQFSTWLTRIAIHEALGRLRRSRRVFLGDSATMEGVLTMAQDEAGGGSTVRATDPEENASARELAGLIEHAVDELPDGYRTVFVLREVEHLSTAETAAALDISEELVKVRLHRARGELRRRLDARVGAATREVFAFGHWRCDRMVQRVLERIGALSPTASSEK